MDFTEPWEFGDITFVVEDRNIYANKLTMMMSSDVFKTMFTADFKEKDMTEVPLPDKMFDEFLELMEVLHPQVLKRVDGSNVYSILPLAHEYQMRGVFRNCICVLSRGPPSIQSFNMVEEYNLNLPVLHKKCISYMKETPLTELKAEAGFDDLKPAILIEVLDHKVQILEPLQTLKAEVRNLANWNWKNPTDTEDICPSGSYIMHRKGEGKKCLTCSKYKLEEIWQVVGKY